MIVAARARWTLRGGLLMLLAALSGCGFHLVGTETLPAPLQSMYIDAVDPYSVSEPPLEGALQQRIEGRGGHVRSKIEEASSVLRLSHLVETRDTVAIGSNGKATQYRLTTHVTYELLAGAKDLVPQGTLTVSREYSFSADQILAKQQEESRLRAFNQGEIADLLLLRLEATLSHARPAG